MALQLSEMEIPSWDDELIKTDGKIVLLNSHLYKKKTKEHLNHINDLNYNNIKSFKSWYNSFKS